MEIAPNIGINTTLGHKCINTTRQMGYNPI